MRPVLIPIRLAIGVAAVCAMSLTFRATPASAQAFCVGDCNSNNEVLVNELITCVNTALGGPLTCTQCDANGDGMVLINELVLAVNNALGGCPSPGVTPTATSPGESATPTATVTTISCPLEPGRYTITSVEGGSLKVANLSSFPFPAGGKIIAEVGAPDANCVHSVIVPADGGFQSPTFCIPSLQFSVSVQQRACGIGQMDSDGGADYTVTELGDTSDKNGPCNSPQTSCPAVGPAPDNKIRVQVKVGDGTTDACSGGGTANALVAIPVRTTTWIEINEGEAKCPGDSFDPEQGDGLVTRFPQTLDFTTDTNSAKFQDLDGDGCFVTGTGPRNGTTFSSSGACMNLDTKTIATGASGAIGSMGAPLYDILFTTFLPNVFTGPEPSTGATCEDPPLIDFTGTVDRCITEQ